MSITESQSRFGTLKSFFRRERKVNILVDGPNVLRRVNKRQIKIEDIDAIANKMGTIKNRFIFLNDHASKKLVEAMINSGYVPLICQSDVYVQIAMKALQVGHQNDGDVLLIASRDARVVPIIMKLNEKGVETAIVGFDPGFSVALKNVANHAYELK